METVYFYELPEKSTLEERMQGTRAILEASGMDKILSKKAKVAVKIHVGEKKNTTHVAPQIAKIVVERIKRNGASPFFIETSTLYKGERSNAVDHLNHAHAHGFGYDKVGAPFIMADGLFGNSEIEVEIPGKIYSSVSIARDAVYADALVAISHPTGHVGEGLGACIKNIGMGLASRKGKLRMHSSVKPSINKEHCTFCRQCILWCPEEAIIEQDGKAFILSEKCIGCGECLAVCKFDAVEYNWGVESEDLQRRTAEHAFGVIIGKQGKLFCLNYLTDMTRDCDCTALKQEPLLPDVGILASIDPIAIDQATIDLTREKAGNDLSTASYPRLDGTIQLQHGEAIGMGSRKYNLVRVT
jgi:uncharacterized Fe-S center protein